MKKRPTERAAAKDFVPQTTHRPTSVDLSLRIIGGAWRGRRIRYSGDPRTRPMKDNIREAVFNLVGGWIPGKLIIDLFAGTGAIGLEAISRGAAHAIFVERHIPTAQLLEQNIRDLSAEAQSTVVTSDTFFWSRQFLKHPPPHQSPWAVFCSPPYALYHEQPDAMAALIATLFQNAPAESIFVVETDAPLDSKTLPHFTQWRVREYSPAWIYVWRPNG